MKELTVRQIAAVKRQFLNSLPAFKKVQKLQDKIRKLQEEIDIELAMIEGGEAGIKALTGGYRSIDLIQCTYEDYLDANGQPKLDKAGRVIKKQVLTFKYPEEIAVPETIGNPGSDYDMDAENWQKVDSNYDISTEIAEEVADAEVSNNPTL